MKNIIDTCTFKKPFLQTSMIVNVWSEKLKDEQMSARVYSKL